MQAFSEELKSVPHGYPLMLAAWLELREAPRTLTLTAPEADDAFRAELARAHRAVAPGRVVIPVLGSQREALESLGVDVGVAGKRSAILCEDETCREF